MTTTPAIKLSDVPQLESGWGAPPKRFWTWSVRLVERGTYRILDQQPEYLYCESDIYLVEAIRMATACYYDEKYLAVVFNHEGKAEAIYDQDKQIV